jgi:hypothetical protein
MPISSTTAADLPEWLTRGPTASQASGDAPDLDNDTLAWLNTLSGEPSAAEPAAPARTRPGSLR